MHSVKKAVILLGGLGTRFLPVTKAVPKEMIPIIDKPVFHYLIEEAIASGMKEIILVTSPEKKKLIQKYLEPSSKLEKFLRKRKREHLIKDLPIFPKDVSLKICLQRRPLGDGHAILQAKNLIGNEAFGLFFGDDIIDSETPALLQLSEIYEKYRSPILALEKVPESRLHLFGVVKIERTASRLSKIRGIVEKPLSGEAPSDLAIVGRYVLSPEIFDVLGGMKPGPRKEIILADALQVMVKKGKPIYGLEYKGNWLSCGDKLGFLKTTVLFGMKDGKLNKEFKGFLKGLKF